MGYLSVTVEIHGIEVQVHGGLCLVHKEFHQQLHEVTQEVVQQGLLNLVKYLMRSLILFSEILMVGMNYRIRGTARSG